MANKVSFYRIEKTARGKDAEGRLVARREHSGDCPEFCALAH